LRISGRLSFVSRWEEERYPVMPRQDSSSSCIRKHFSEASVHVHSESDPFDDDDDAARSSRAECHCTNLGFPISVL
jgi:hypothetical protein